MNNSYTKLTQEIIFKLLSKRFNDTFLSLKDLPNPYMFHDMDRSISRIVKAIDSKEKIIIIGDYDVDGVISVSVIVKFFTDMNLEIDWIIPNRFRDGYGLSTTLIPRVKDYDLVITVDNGISAIEASTECKKLGIDLIITDHHIVPDILPDAYTIVNQKKRECTFPYKEICGAQIAWYLCSALNKALNVKIDMKSYLEMVSIAIIADIMPLQDINRAMVKAGLKIFNKSNTPFIVAYRDNSLKKEFTAEDIAFGLAPIINSAGRLDDASLAVEFIISRNIYEARSKYEQLKAFNEERKGLEELVTLEASKDVNLDDKVIVATSTGWHEGVLGIVAARLARKFERPAIILTKNGNVLKGSGRTFNDCNLFDLIYTQRELLEKFGGHNAAAGLSIKSDNIIDFRNGINKIFTDKCQKKEFINPDIIGLLPFKYINFTLIEMISQFEPFGEKNPKPKFISRDVEILAVQTMGNDHNHLRFTFKQNEYMFQAVQFKTFEKFNIGDRVDILYKIDRNHFRGDITIQLIIEKCIKND